jgi:hypothetical protein
MKKLLLTRDQYGIWYLQYPGGLAGLPLMLQAEDPTDESSYSYVWGTREFSIGDVPPRAHTICEQLLSQFRKIRGVADLTKVGVFL